MNSGMPPSIVNSPIADLSYRGYDGPLRTHFVRWWIVSLATIRPTLRKPGFWIVFAISMLIYVFAAFGLYFQATSGAAQLAATINGEDIHQRFARTFFNTFQFNSLLVFIMALIVGAGCIAADNRANALLVYLAKPITKGDYLLGKWMGIFTILFGAVLTPMLLLYIFCLLTFYNDGFLRNEPLLILRIILASAIPGAIYASIFVGLSAWSKSGRVAGAVAAGIFFFSLIASASLASVFYKDQTEGLLLRHLSLPGVIDGLAQNVLGVTLKVGGGFMMEPISIPPPPLLPIIAISAALVVLGVGAARMKVRAVEVVRG